MSDGEMQVRELKVVLDTNAIYNVAGHKFLRDEVSNLIKSSSNHTDLLITWYLPEVVRNEREQQLRKDALEDLPTIQRLERVLGSSFDVGAELIITRIRQRVNDYVKDLNLQILPVDATKVDWDKMMFDAAFRHPPFSPGKSEKGFRDALIAEAVQQVVATSSECRIAVVTGDELLTKALIAKTVAEQHVYILPSIEQLKGLINTLVSNVDESFIAQMRAAAKSFFFDPETRVGFIYEQKIKEQILKDFHSRIYELPAGANEVERGKTLVSSPRFKDKKVDRMYWVTRIAFRMKGYGEESSPIVTTSVPAFGYSGYSGYTEFAGYSPIIDDASTSDDIESGELSSVVSLGPPVSYKLARLPSKIGHVAFDVTWSISVTPQHELKDPSVESIDYVETSWEQ